MNMYHSKNDVLNLGATLAGLFDVEIGVSAYSPGDGRTRFEIQTGGAHLHVIGARAAYDVLQGVRAGILAAQRRDEIAEAVSAAEAGDKFKAAQADEANAKAAIPAQAIAELTPFAADAIERVACTRCNAAAGLLCRNTITGEVMTVIHEVRTDAWIKASDVLTNPPSTAVVGHPTTDPLSQSDFGGLYA